MPSVEKTLRETKINFTLKLFKLIIININYILMYTCYSYIQICVEEGTLDKSCKHHLNN